MLARRHRVAAAAAAILLTLSATHAGVVLTPDDAPEWEISEWVNGNPGSLADHGGRVVLIHFFQMWCPGCNEFTVPLFQHWSELYSEHDDVLILGIHTVFEGHNVQTPDALRAYLEAQGIAYPVGIDAYDSPGDETPVTMQRYKTEGTPQVAIVDKHGKLRFFHFADFDYYVVEGLIDRLLKEVGPQPGRAKPVAREDPVLSGRYRVTMSQTSKTCGKLIRPLTLDMEVTVTGTEVRVRSRQAFAGMSDLTARYDPATGRIDARVGRRITERGEQVNVNLRVQGVFKKDRSPAELEYTFSFEKSGDKPELQCKIDGRGKGTKSDPNRRR